MNPHQPTVQPAPEAAAEPAVAEPAAGSEPAVPAAVMPPAQASAGASAPVHQGAAGGGWFSMLMLMVALVALVLSGMLWQRLEHIQQELAKRSTEAAEQSSEARETAAQAEALTRELQARLSVAEVKLSEVSLQRTQLEELMLSVSRSRDDTLVLDIESGLRLAIQQAELTGSTQPLVSALQAADRRISKAAQPRLNPVQRAMTRDIERIRNATVTDLPALSLRLDELVRLVDELPVRNAPPRPRQGLSRPPQPDAEAEVSGPAEGVPAETQAPRPGVKGKPVPVPEVGWADQWSGRWHAFWADASTRVVAALKDLVRVSRIDEPEAVLMAPDQAFFLRENLKLKLLNARLGLLSRQVPAARADLTAARNALTKYFDPQAPVSRQAQQAITDVLQATRTVVLPRPDDTLAALTAAANGR